MEIIAKPRRTGKTHLLIEKFLESPNDTVIVCGNEDMAAYVRRWISGADPELTPELLRKNVIGAHNAPEKLRGLSSRILVDNTEWVLAALLGRAPESITITYPAEP